MRFRAWPAAFDRPGPEPQWAWRMIGVSVTLFLLAAVVAVLGGVLVLLLLALQ